ncbi:RNA pol II transcription cofactor [Friedmanniomyces endolithicus]|nr:RNA pol II transcription cofactor [Friedmanniomyces endolithicus]KAK0842761.1 RNA pol II transcription cofactor [Friedmanniomyces endolithicus]KAK0907007.1 RNA pol II transcription cofactor [Friedmanniomyces endolithicus]
MPHEDGTGRGNEGMQLWVDLPRELKETEPRYRDLRASEIPRVTADEGRVGVKVISGRSYGVDSVRELAYTPVWLLDVTIQAGGRFRQALPAGWNAFAYTLEGTTTFGTGATRQEVARYHNAVFEQKGDQVLAHVPADAKEAARFLLVAGMPLDQPVVQYGPFVLNDASGVRQAIMDYQSFQNGFERAEGWQSEIGRAMV